MCKTYGQSCDIMYSTTKRKQIVGFHFDQIHIKSEPQKNKQFTKTIHDPLDMLVPYCVQ